MTLFPEMVQSNDGDDAMSEKVVKTSHHRFGSGSVIINAWGQKHQDAVAITVKPDNTGDSHHVFATRDQMRAIMLAIGQALAETAE